MRMSIGRCSANVTFFRLLNGPLGLRDLISRIGTYVDGQSIRSLKGRCYGNLFLARIGENWYARSRPAFILCAGIPQRMGRSQHDARVNSAEDPAMSDKNLMNFNPVTLSFGGAFAPGGTR